jgi:hypothetical protein
MSNLVVFVGIAWHAGRGVINEKVVGFGENAMMVQKQCS